MNEQQEKEDYSKLKLEEEEKSLLRSIENNFICVVCGNQYEDPVHYTCGHIFCRECVINGGAYCQVCNVPVKSKEIVKSTFAVNLLHAYQSFQPYFQNDLTYDIPIPMEHEQSDIKSPAAAILSPEQGPGLSHLILATSANLPDQTREYLDEETVMSPQPGMQPLMTQTISSHGKEFEKSPNKIKSPDKIPSSLQSAMGASGTVDQTVKSQTTDSKSNHSVEPFSTYGFWENEIEATKRKIEMILENSPAKSVAVTQEEQKEEKTILSPIKVNPSQETIRPFSSSNTASDILPLKAIISYQSDASKLIAEQCIARGLITCSGEDITLDEPIKILVVETTEADHTLTERSLIYIKCLLLGYYIVSFEWLKECLAQNTFLDYRSYEVSGTLNDEMKGTPRLSRIYQRDKLGRVDLLKDYNFILLETDNPKGYLIHRTNIEWIIYMCQGAILPDATAESKRKNFITLKLKLPSKKEKRKAEIPRKENGKGMPRQS